MRANNDNDKTRFEELEKIRRDIDVELSKLPQGHPLLLVMKRAHRQISSLLKGLKDIVDSCQQTLQESLDHNTRISVRLKAVYTEYNLSAYGYDWDDNLNPEDNVENLIANVFDTMRFGRIGWLRLKRAVEIGDPELIERIAREITSFPEVSVKMPDEDKEISEEPIKAYL